MYTAHCLRYNLANHTLRFTVQWTAHLLRASFTWCVEREDKLVRGSARTIVVTEVDDGIVRVLGHALEGAKVCFVLGHCLANGSVQVPQSTIFIL